MGKAGIDVNFMVGGEAGQGYHVFADEDDESRVRGGHDFFRFRVKDSG